MKCPYCEQTKSNESGLSMHMKYMHPDKWNRTLKQSLPEGFNIGQPGGRKLVKGMKKPKIHNKCPWCPYKSDHPPGLSRHIKCSHPDHWKGDLGLSLGRESSRRQWTKKTKVMNDNQKKINRRAYNAKRRANFIAMGLTSSGSERKRNMRPAIARRYKHVLKHKIEPIVYHAPQETTPVTTSLMDQIIDRVAQKIAEKLLQ